MRSTIHVAASAHSVRIHYHRHIIRSFASHKHAYKGTHRFHDEIFSRFHSRLESQAKFMETEGGKSWIISDTFPSGDGRAALSKRRHERLT